MEWSSDRDACKQKAQTSGTRLKVLLVLEPRGLLGAWPRELLTAEFCAGT